MKKKNVEPNIDVSVLTKIDSKTPDSFPSANSNYTATYCQLNLFLTFIFGIY